MRSRIKISSLALVLTMLLACASCAADPGISDGSLSGSGSGSDSGLSSEYASESPLGSLDSKDETTSIKKETDKKETTKKETTGPKRTFTLNTTNPWKYSTDYLNNVKVRTVNISTGWGGETVTIGQVTDLHINYCTQNDLNDPVLKSTYENRLWLKNGASLPNVERCLESLKKSDLVVVTGDLYDYYSEGVVQKSAEYVFDKYDNVVACIGNHEVAMQMQGTVPETKTLDQRRALVQDSWCGDIEYASYVVKNKVMVILLDDSDGLFHAIQYNRLKADLTKARNNGYVVLIFYHIPMNTGNPAYAKTNELSGANEIAYLNGVSIFPGYEGSTSEGDRKVTELIRTNGDIIKGCFCGHNHGDYYSEILATTPSGQSTIIPQYLVDGGAYDSGHVLKIEIT